VDYLDDLKMIKTILMNEIVYSKNGIRLDLL